ncbi:MAG: DNA polymerase I [Anaerolineales bacterium]|nr:DNA polymerase I [Anaerolineales bacterium]
MTPKLYLLDGHALAYRAYFALTAAGTQASRWITAQGEPTAGTYGFTSILLSLLEKEKPQYLAVAFDTGRTFRDDLYPEYKATRAKMPEDLRPQIDRIREVVRAFRIPVLEAEGFEADDVLGTVARQAGKEGTDALILSGDRDLLQLIDDKVSVRLPGRSLSESTDYDAARFQQEWGFPPLTLIDYKALVGDKSDNIPGVPGVGEKTATELLKKFGSFDSIYENLDNIPPRYRAKLEAGRESALLSRRLATIRTDAPVAISLEACRAGQYAREEIAALFQTLEFRTLLSRLPASASSGIQLGMFAEAKPRPEPGRWQLVDDEGKLADLAEKISRAPVLAVDTETTSTDPMRAELVGVSFSVAEGEGYYLPLRHADGPNLDFGAVKSRLAAILADPRIPKAGHNIKYDLTVLARAGLPISAPAFDTMIAEWLCNPASRNLGLKDLGFVRLGVEMTPIEALIGKGAKQTTMDRVPAAQAAPYAAADADVTLRLVAPLRKEMEERSQTKLFEEMEMPLIPILAAMEQEGVTLDLPYLSKLGDDFQAELRKIETEVHALIGRPFNLNSTQQLADALFGQLQLQPPDKSRKTAAGKYSTAADVLESLVGQHPVVELILRHRELSKLLSTYVLALRDEVNPVTGRVHTSYNQTGTVTGRVSSSDPNLQNIPTRTEEGRRLRRAFTGTSGRRLLSIDYSQIELRLAAHMAKDPGMTEAFRRGEDIHAATAAAVYGVPLAEVTPAMRRHAKAVNFGLLYGQTAFGLTRSTDMTLSDAEKFISTYFERFAGIRDFVQNTKRLAARQGYVETMLGRRRYFPELGPTARLDVNARNRAEREAVNAPVQGSAADIMKIAMIRLPDALSQAGLDARMILQVHDELVLDCPPAEIPRAARIVRQIMEGVLALSVPLVADAKEGPNWEEMQAVKLPAE